VSCSRRPDAGCCASADNRLSGRRAGARRGRLSGTAHTEKGRNGEREPRPAWVFRLPFSFSRFLRVGSSAGISPVPAGRARRQAELNCPHREKENRRKGATPCLRVPSPFLLFLISLCGQFRWHLARSSRTQDTTGRVELPTQRKGETEKGSRASPGRDGSVSPFLVFSVWAVPLISRRHQSDGRYDGPS
jgi:hypothetical protein